MDFKSEKFRDIQDIEFIENAFNKVFFEKLFTEGYVYCEKCLEGYKKEDLIRLLEKANSIFIKLFKGSLEIKQYDGLEVRLSKFRRVMMSIDKVDKTSSHLSQDIAMSIVFALLFNSSKSNYDFSYDIYEILGHLYPETSNRYIVKNGYIQLLNIKVVNINSISNFMDEIEKIKYENNMFFRGHSNINYISIPSLFREKRFYESENILYQELVIRCPKDFVKCNTHLEFLVEMQHYGLPTRLLDITSNPLVALYFACTDKKSVGEVMIYSIPTKDLKYGKSDTVSILSSLPMFRFEDQKSILDKSLKCKDIKCFNLIESEELISRLIHEIRIEKPAFVPKINPEHLRSVTFVKAEKKNGRVLHQDGAFAIFGLMEDIYSENQNKCKHLKEVNPLENYRYYYEDNNKKVVFAIHNKESILKMLNKLGINKAFLFPEIDDVSAYLKDKIGTD